uniref:ATP-binding cassette sub-family A member 1-like n=1 Tax=Phallusia mammillata TaxID=59560 RepID=A0A6F9D4V8_9ASCI|nr:ATP-binding cassette sub-family A member 1-like [Phallusia mammillata]
MFWKQLYLLLWKNWIIRKRHPVRTIIEILWPLVLLLALIAIRKVQVVEEQGECHYPARAMPSAGVYPWFKSLVCDIQNPCFNVSVSSETPGQINDPASIANGSMATNSLASIFTLLSTNTTIFNNLGQLTSDLALLSNATQSAISNVSLNLSSLLDDPTGYNTYLTGTLALSGNVASTIVNSNVTFLQAVSFSTTLGTRAVVCNPTAVNSALQIPAAGPSTAQDVSTALCNLTDNELELFSNKSTENLGNATVVVQKFQMQGVNAIDPSAFNSTVVSAAQGRLNNTILELQGIQGPLTDALNILNQGTSATSLVSLLLGVNASSPNVVEEVCGHPQKTETILSSFVTTVSGNSSIGTAFSNLFNPVVAGMMSDAQFCQNFNRLMQSNPNISVVWNTAKVFLYGKITYSPDSPLVQQIIKEANATFATVAFIQQSGEYWRSTNGPALFQTLESGNTTTNLRQLLNNQFAVNLILSQTNITAAQIEQLKVFLSNDENPNDNVTTWKETFRQIDGLILVATKLLNCFELDKFVGYANEDDLVLNSLALLDNSSLFGGIVFESLSSSDNTLPEVLKYKIRQDTQSVTRTNRIQRRLVGASAESRTDQVKYYISGFVHLQDMVESAILRFRNSDNTYKPTGSYLQFMPYPCYTRDTFLEFLSGLLSLIMTLAWIYSVCIIIKNIVYEKEQRLKEVMKMMGLSNGVHWVAWFINSFSIMVISVFFMMIVLRAGDIFPFSNMFLVFLWLSLFVISVIGQCFLISTFFSRANLAAACGGIIFFLFYIPYNMLVVWQDTVTYGTQIGACLLSNVAFGYGAAYISDYELTGDGIQFSNWLSSTEAGDRLNFATTLGMLLLDSIIYFTLTWYVENVFPGQYGVPRPWYFFATRSYWFGPSKRKDSKQPANGDVENLNANVEAEPTENKLGVAIHNIKKVYSNGKVAVDNLSINFYEDQITSFLGHNGAGKTTTMSMLTGLFTPTDGTAYVYGNDICTEMDSIRSQLGFCPQHNVLFGE